MTLYAMRVIIKTVKRGKQKTSNMKGEQKWKY
nr:MAG TPA: hypothetical protein [Caudoviricetes sp.]